jgi:hypothetical protein
MNFFMIVHCDPESIYLDSCQMADYNLFFHFANLSSKTEKC